MVLFMHNSLIDRTGNTINVSSDHVKMSNEEIIITNKGENVNELMINTVINGFAIGGGVMGNSPPNYFHSSISR